MAASTAGMIVLRDKKTGNSRSETFTMTPSANQYVTWTATGNAFILTSPNGEYIVDLQVNNDGKTTVTQGLFKVDGADIRNRYLLVLFAADSTMPNRIVNPIEIGGSKQLQFQMLA